MKAIMKFTMTRGCESWILDQILKDESMLLRWSAEVYAEPCQTSEMENH